MLREGVPPLPPRTDLIHSLDVRAPYLETLDKLVDWDRLRAAKFRFVVDPMHGAGRGLLRDLFRRHGIACDEIRGTRDPLFGGVNPEPIEPHVEALRRRSARRANTTPASRSMATATASARWTATARSSRRTRFFPFCSGIWPARANSPATSRKLFPPRK